jgi:hypothetical protein
VLQPRGLQPPRHDRVPGVPRGLGGSRGSGGGGTSATTAAALRPLLLRHLASRAAARPDTPGRGSLGGETAGSAAPRSGQAGGQCRSEWSAKGTRSMLGLDRIRRWIWDREEQGLAEEVRIEGAVGGDSEMVFREGEMFCRPRKIQRSDDDVRDFFSILFFF